MAIVIMSKGYRSDSQVRGVLDPTGPMCPVREAGLRHKVRAVENIWGHAWTVAIPHERSAERAAHQAPATHLLIRVDGQDEQPVRGFATERAAEDAAAGPEKNTGYYVKEWEIEALR